MAGIWSPKLDFIACMHACSYQHTRNLKTEICYLHGEHPHQRWRSTRTLATKSTHMGSHAMFLQALAIWHARYNIQRTSTCTTNLNISIYIYIYIYIVPSKLRPIMSHIWNQERMHVSMKRELIIINNNLIKITLKMTINNVQE